MTRSARRRLLARPLGSLAGLERLARPAALPGHARIRRSRGASTNTIKSHRSSQPASSKIAASSTTTGRGPQPCPSRSITVKKPGPHPRVKNRLKVATCRGIGEHDRAKARDRCAGGGRAGARFSSTPVPNRSTIRPRTPGSSRARAPPRRRRSPRPPALCQQRGDLTLAAADTPDQADHGSGAVLPALGMRTALELARHGLIDEDAPQHRRQRGSHGPRTSKSIVSGRAHSSRDPSGRRDASRREHDHVISRPVNHRGGRRCRLSG